MKEEHFNLRTRQRYGIKLKKKDKARIRAGIRNNEYEIEYDQGDKKCYLVPHKGKWLKIIYGDGHFITALPLNKNIHERKIQSRRKQGYKRDRKKIPI